ncbi:hypothetical protein PVK06_039278 [Gossypium arboreum]|uniref:C-type lectin domain-containing protein n=1 Tax=Gossypium arboreum TaxID=29729 RepID=A0ABR0N2G4_GOSAR|nr:hypothetical protein PVK06_039278 [Gossypium arboreum]
MVLIYSLMIENHSREGVWEGTSDGSWFGSPALVEYKETIFVCWAVDGSPPAYDMNWATSSRSASCTRAEAKAGTTLWSPLPPQYSSHPGSYLSQYSAPSGQYPPLYSTPLEPYPLLYFTPPGLYPPPFSTPPIPYLPPYSTPPGSSSSMAFETYDFSFILCTPLHTDEENVDRRSRS